MSIIEKDFGALFPFWNAIRGIAKELSLSVYGAEWSANDVLTDDHRGKPLVVEGSDF